MTIKVGTLVAGRIIVEDLTVGSEEEPAGITFFDRKTKEPYCFVIEDGAPKTYKGKCEGNDFGEANLLNSESTNTEQGGGAPSSEPEPSINAGPTPETQTASSSEPAGETVIEPNTEPMSEPISESPPAESLPETPATGESSVENTEPVSEPPIVETPPAEPVNEPTQTETPPETNNETPPEQSL